MSQNTEIIKKVHELLKLLDNRPVVEKREIAYRLCELIGISYSDLVLFDLSSYEQVIKWETKAI